MTRSADKKPHADLHRTKQNSNKIALYTSERGSGLIGMVGGVTVFLVLLTFAVQLLFNLYATSVVSAVAHDAAQRVASASLHSDDESAQMYAMTQAESEGRELLGRYGDEANFTWEIDDRTVRLTLTTPPLRVAIRQIAGVFGDPSISRSVEIRLEATR